MSHSTSLSPPRPARKAAGRSPARTRRAALAAERRARVQGLEAVFPACGRVLGRAPMRRLLDRFVRMHRWEGSALHEHARQLPGFLLLGRIAGPGQLLADLARLEVQVLRAQLSAAAPAAGAAAFAARLADPVGLPDLRFELQAASALLESRYPIGSAWLGRPCGGSSHVQLTGQGESVLVTRGADGVSVAVLDAPASLLAASLLCQSTLGEALDIVGAAHPDVDLGAALAAVIASGLISALIG